MDWKVHNHLRQYNMIYDNVDHELVHLLRMSGNEDVRDSLIDVVCLSRKSIFLYVKARTARRGFRINSTSPSVKDAYEIQTTTISKVIDNSILHTRLLKSLFTKYL